MTARTAAPSAVPAAARGVLATLADQALEVLVVPSFTRLGYAARSRLFAWTEPEPGSMTGTTAVITGPTSGLGREAAGWMARLGARLVLVGRDQGRLEATRRELLAGAPGADVATVVADMSSLVSVRSAADEILRIAPRIDVLVDNAGAMFPERAETPEGIERTLATMVVGPFVLLARLWPRLAATPGARVVAVTSGGMYTQALPLDDLGYARGAYQGAKAYARAKRAQVALAREWARRLAPHGVAVNAMHPGWADTPGLEASLPGFRRLVGGALRSPREGADTIVWLAASPEARGLTGRLLLDRRARPFDRLPGTRLGARDRRALWDAVAGLSGERAALPGRPAGGDASG